MAMEEKMAGLNIDDGKEEVLSLRIDVGSQTVTYELCLGIEELYTYTGASGYWEAFEAKKGNYDFTIK
ncbi:hypothetical protein Gotur_003905, partial [Gossypium turneri]